MIDGHGVYLICFGHTPLAHAKHYLGWASNINERIATHRKGGKGCGKLLAAVNKAGIAWRVVRVWPGAEKDFERKLKKSGHGPKLCPHCSPRANSASGVTSVTYV